MNERWPETQTLQRGFVAAIGDASRSDVILPALRGDAERMRGRLAVYRGNTRANWLKALRGAYPIVAQLVGDEFFAGLAREYGRAHPSTSGDLNEFGDGLANFVDAFAPAQSLPYLPDVARMEWLAHSAYYAANAPVYDLSRLAALAEADYAALCCVPAPAVAVLASRWPLARIWAAHQTDFAGDIAVDLEAGPDWVLIHRPQFKVVVSALTAGEFAFLRACVRGATLAPALAAATAAGDGFDLGAALAGWARESVIADFRLGDRQGAST
jgi:uncharacterized protein